MPRAQSLFRPLATVFLFSACATSLTLTACSDEPSGSGVSELTSMPTTGPMPSTPSPAVTTPLMSTPAATPEAVPPAMTPMQPMPVDTPMTPAPVDTIAVPTAPTVSPEPIEEMPPPAPVEPAVTDDVEMMPVDEPVQEMTDPVDPEPEPSAGAMPSAGCGGGNANANVANADVDMPNDYDGSTPAPMFFAFHGAGGDSSSLKGPFASEAKARGYIGVYLKSTGSAWEPRVDTAVLDEAYNSMLENYCVDINRVFAIGHSSGAQMITQLLCNGETRFRAVAPVASSKYCNGWDPVNAVVIHGLDDIERGGQGEMRYGLNDGDGHIDFGVYHDSNECTDATTPFDPGGNCGANINPGCVEYDDCTARTVFCNHDDPQYGTSNHGVPCFAAQAVFGFFDEHL